MANIELEPGATNPPSELQKTNIRSALGCGQTGDNEFSTNKASLTDGDKVAILDSVDSDAPKHTLWSLVKSTLKTYFDTLYFSLTNTSTGGNGAADSGKAALFGTSGDTRATSQFVLADETNSDRQIVAACEGGSVMSLSFVFGGAAPTSTLDATTFTAARAWSVPDGSGTLALTSQTDGSITSADISDASTGGNGDDDAGKAVVYDLSGTIKATNSFELTGTNGGTAGIQADNLTDDRELQLPNGSGTVALTSQTDGSITQADVTNAVKAVTTTSDTLVTTDYLVLVDDDTAAAAVTINLPAASGNVGLTYKIKKTGTTGNVTIDGNGSETIDGSATAVLTTQYESLTIVCDGSNWHII